jgi:FKBP-type peptidyl-prolyl cis-trans isomerase FklB
MMKSIEKVAASLTKWVLPFCLLTVVPLVSCEEDDDDDINEAEYDNWQQRNDEQLADWASDTSLKKIKYHALHEDAPTVNSDYIYVKVLETGDFDTSSPFLTDTVRIAYRGRILPTVTYPEGRVFDQSYLNEFSWQTAYPAQFPPRGTQNSPLIGGLETALLHMHVGDRWLIHVPYQLGYGTSEKSTIPAYSNLIFDVALFDFWHPGETRPVFKVR